MMQRTTKDDSESDFDPLFALPYPAPFTHWYLGGVGEERLHVARSSRAQQPNSDKGSLDGANGGRVLAESVKLFLQKRKQSRVCISTPKYGRM
jgi:hypothetical protein